MFLPRFSLRRLTQFRRLESLDHGYDGNALGELQTSGKIFSRRAKFALGLRLPRKELKVSLRGFCNVCGNDAQFSVTESPNLRESLYCSSCGSKARNRMLASGLLRIASAPPFQSIAALASAPAGPKIFDTDCYGPIFQFLRKADFYSSSVYIPRKPFGVNIFDKVINVDLQNMPLKMNRST